MDRLPWKKLRRIVGFAAAPLGAAAVAVLIPITRSLLSDPTWIAKSQGHFLEMISILGAWVSLGAIPAAWIVAPVGVAWLRRRGRLGWPDVLGLGVVIGVGFSLLAAWLAHDPASARSAALEGAACGFGGALVYWLIDVWPDLPRAVSN